MQNSWSEKTFEVIAGNAWHMSKQKTVLPFFPQYKHEQLQPICLT